MSPVRYRAKLVPHGTFHGHMNILLSNDDGIRAPGLWAATRELGRLGSVTVVAPDREQSGVGTSITFHRPLRFKKEIPEVGGVRAFSVEGTPGDSIILALRLPLVEKTPDVVVSGINEGANLGDDVFISGTVGAVLQGYFNGLMAVSISVAVPIVNDFNPAAQVLGCLVARMRDASLPGRILLNVNVPAGPVVDIQDVRITRLGERRYADVVEEGSDGRRKYYWIGRGQTDWLCKEGTDHWAIERKMCSVTPLVAGPVRSVHLILKKIASQAYQDLTARAQKRQ